MSQRAIAAVVAALAAAVGVGAGVGAGTYAVLDDDPAATSPQSTVEQPEPTDSRRLSIAQVYERSHRGVVEIVAGATEGSPFEGPQQAQGSGFVYDRDGHVVTNQHVVAGARSIAVRFWNEATHAAELVGVDSSTDLAVVRVDAPASLLEPLRLANSDDLDVGEAVVAIGSPFGLDGTLTSGIVSALHRQMTAPNDFTINDSIQTDAAVNHGNSGGPLLNLSGQVVGVNAQIESESGGNDGVGFAIPSNTVRSVVSQLIESGSVEHAYLGITMVTVPDGVAVTEVRSGTPAEEAGLREATGSETVNGEEIPAGGDVIVAIDGRGIDSTAELQSAIDTKKPGDRVTLTIVRDGERRAIDVTLGTRPDSARG